MSNGARNKIVNMAQNVRRIVATPAAPAAIGPYNQAVVANNTMYVSGQLGLNPETMDFDSDDVVDQTNRALKNVGAVLESQGASFRNVVKTTILLADIKDYPKVNEVYAKYFEKPYPARAAYAVTALPKLGRVEIEAVAILGDIKDE